MAGTAPKDYTDPVQFFSRTCFTDALTRHSGMVLRRLSGETSDTAPVLTLITQFGGGKTHTLTSLYHLANAGKKAAALPGVVGLLSEASVTEVPSARVGVFVGNAWDPAEGKETPWIDLARQIAGDKGVAELGSTAKTIPPGTDALSRMFAAAEAPVLLLFDEVLNFVNRHRTLAESFHAFLQNLTVAITGMSRAAAVISLPRSQVEMTEWDQDWQNRITKVVRRVARDLIANDESEISEVVRRRLFEDLGSERTRERVAKIYSQWCFERSARLPPEWTSVDTAIRSSKGQAFLKSRFESCYPFHPSTLSVFQRKWRALPQFQQTRGALAMLAQWISWAASEHFRQARKEPLITLGSAPLHIPEFRAVVLGQLGESRLDVAIDADLSSETAHARSLDADTKDVLRDIHRRVGTAILFESSGGQVDKVAHLPELRFDLGEPNVETTTIDNAASALERSSFFIRKVGTDGYRIHHQATLRKVVSDRRASLDEEIDIKPAVRKVVEGEFARGATVPVVYFPDSGDTVRDSPRLMLVVLDPDEEWRENGYLYERLGQWTEERHKSSRLYPGAIVWCIRKPGRELQEKVELWLAWRRVAHELEQGVLGAEYDRADHVEVHTRVREAEEVAKDEVWASYRFVVLKNTQAIDGLRVIDLGAGHTSGSESLCGRIIAALKSDALLDESVGAGYIDRHWPPALKDSGVWPLISLRQCFLNGTLTRLIDPDPVLKRRIVDFVKNGYFGLASGDKGDGRYERFWYEETIGEEEVTFEADVFLLTKARADQLLGIVSDESPIDPSISPAPSAVIEPPPESDSKTSSPTPNGSKVMVRLKGTVPPEAWNRLSVKILSKLKTGEDLSVGVEFSVRVDSALVGNFESELRRALADLGLSEQLWLEEREP